MPKRKSIKVTSEMREAGGCVIENSVSSAVDWASLAEYVYIAMAKISPSYLYPESRQASSDASIQRSET